MVYGFSLLWVLQFWIFSLNETACTTLHDSLAWMHRHRAPGAGHCQAAGRCGKQARAGPSRFPAALHIKHCMIMNLHRKQYIVRNVCKVSLLFSALYAMCPYYLVLYMQNLAGCRRRRYRYTSPGRGPAARVRRACGCARAPSWDQGQGCHVSQLSRQTARQVHLGRALYV